MGIVRQGPPTELMLSLSEKFKISNFVETGTYYGATALWAAQKFERVYTVEYARGIYDQVSTKYRHISNVEFLFGDSRKVLADIIPKLTGPAMFWLDSHWYPGQPTYGENDQCPLIEEIEIINRSAFEHFILIDDARLFLSAPPAPMLPEQWPSLDQVMNTLSAGKTSPYVAVIEDILVVTPLTAKEIVVPYCHAINTREWTLHTQSELRRGLRALNQSVSLLSKAARKVMRKSYKTLRGSNPSRSMPSSDGIEAA